MRKIIAASLLCISLVACKAPASTEPDEGYYSSICLDGVEYWHQWRKATLAVRIDPETLKPIKCKSENSL